MESIANAYQSAWEQIIKPTQFGYCDDDIGPEIMVTESGDKILRQKFDVTNTKGFVLFIIVIY